MRPWSYDPPVPAHGRVLLGASLERGYLLRVGFKSRQPALLALLVGSLTGSTALAEDPCADDVRQLCPEVKPGSARIVSCLRENEPRLSVACREKVDADALKARTLVEEFGRACRADVDQFCPTIEPGGGRVLGCLAQHHPELSPSCQVEMNRLAEARERVAGLRTACRADLERVCKGVPSQAGPLLECLQANEAKLSSECNAADLRQAVEASSLVDVLEQMTRQDRVREALQILQGLDSVAFSRSQILLQFDSYERLGNKANGGRLLFNPQFVFGQSSELALQVKVPVSALYPDAGGGPAQFGLGAVFTSFAWNFLAQGRVRQYVALGLQWQTASNPSLGSPWVGAPWALVPSYAIAVGLTRWAALTTQVIWYRSLGSSAGYPEINRLLLEPILVFNLPGRSFLALDTKLGWDFVGETFVPVMKGVAGMFVDRQKSLSISAWYQASLSSTAADETFKYGVGLGLAYYFDW